MQSFVDLCWMKVRNLNEAPVIRRAAVCYIASFMGRAEYIPIAYIQKKLKELCNWAEVYIGRVHTTTNINAMKAHLLFYSICQAIFYIIVIRSRDLTSGKKSKSDRLIDFTVNV